MFYKIIILFLESPDIVKIGGEISSQSQNILANKLVTIGVDKPHKKSTKYFHNLPAYPFRKFCPYFKDKILSKNTSDIDSNINSTGFIPPNTVIAVSLGIVRPDKNVLPYFYNAKYHPRELFVPSLEENKKITFKRTSFTLKADKTEDTKEYEWTVEEIFFTCTNIKLKIGQVDFVSSIPKHLNTMYHSYTIHQHSLSSASIQNIDLFLPYSSTTELGDFLLY